MGHTFSQIYAMCMTSTSNKRYMTCENYINSPMRVVELKMNMINIRNPHHIYTLD